MPATRARPASWRSNSGMFSRNKATCWGLLSTLGEHCSWKLKLAIKSAQAATLYALAEVLIEEDDLKQTREKSDQALALRKDLKRALPLSGSLLQSGEISLEEGKPSEAETLAGDALHQLGATASPAGSAEAYSVRALALLAENKRPEARD